MSTIVILSTIQEESSLKQGFHQEGKKVLKEKQKYKCPGPRMTLGNTQDPALILFAVSIQERWKVANFQNSPLSAPYLLMRIVQKYWNSGSLPTPCHKATSFGYCSQSRKKVLKSIASRN